MCVKDGVDIDGIKTEVLREIVETVSPVLPSTYILLNHYRSECPDLSPSILLNSEYLFLPILNQKVITNRLKKFTSKYLH